MTRFDEITNAANEIKATIERHGANLNVDDFRIGAEWADKNPVNPWISVEERLPEIGREVYLYHYGYFEIARRVVCKDRIYNRDGTHSDTIEWKISHGISYSDISEGDYWMPIPELPK